LTPTRDRSPHSPRWEEFLKAFTARVAKPTSSLLSVRCITKQTLSGIFSEIQQELNLPSTFPSGVAIIAHLISMGFASRIPVEGTAGTAPSKEFILLGIQESQDLDVDPLELLQTYDQQGTICYFSALAYFNLTTQVPVHHHIATLTNQSTTNTNLERSATIVNPKKTNTKSKLGTYLFNYEGVPFYCTKRTKSSIPGIKIRVVSSRTNLRITTIEQTLLDTLQYPFHCGGQEVALEAWGRHIGQIDGDLFLDYLRTIRIDPLTRRVGAIFDLFGIPPARDLDFFLKESKSRILSQPEVPEIPLFRGINSQRINPIWKILVP
jgi:predicted transcriptional regulator of viral defense system